MNVYFRSSTGNLLRLDSPSDDPGLAQVEAYLAACEGGITPATAILAVIDGSKERRDR